MSSEQRWINYDTYSTALGQLSTMHINFLSNCTVIIIVFWVFFLEFVQCHNQLKRGMCPILKMWYNDAYGDLLVECRAAESEADREQRDSQREEVKQTDREQRLHAMRDLERDIGCWDQNSK